MSDEFYVGYLPKMPPAFARRVRLAVAMCLAAAVICAAIFGASQRTFAPSTFEYGKELTFEGTIESSPFPTLVVARPATGAEPSGSSRYTLVGAGKHGADEEVGPFIAKAVRLKGQLIYRDGETLIEVMPGTVSATGTPAAGSESVQELGRVALSGEIVDSKCYFGVMNPGSGKVHRDCAVRCLSGGIPPSFITTNYNGAPASFLLVGQNRQRLPKEVVLSAAGRPVTILGSVSRMGDTWFLATEPAGIRVNH
jgi:hypothetical protein